jgi:predicted phosphate transport protein (TIGR00153 family)
MLTILNLFGMSPFAPLESHMEKVSECVMMLKALFEALDKEDYSTVEQISKKICELEHQADLVKNDIRNHLPKSLFLPIDRGNLLEILSIQDSIADRAEDVAVLATLKKVKMPKEIKEIFNRFLDKNFEAFLVARKIIREMHELLESSFGGIEAEKVRSLVDEAAFKEHEADLIQHDLLKTLFNIENELSYSSFFYWQRIFESLGSVANLSEKLGYRVRMTLELK